MPRPALSRADERRGAIESRPLGGRVSRGVGGGGVLGSGGRRRPRANWWPTLRGGRGHGSAFRPRRLVHAVEGLFRFTQPPDWDEGRSGPVRMCTAASKGRQEALDLHPPTTQVKEIKPPPGIELFRHGDDEKLAERKRTERADPKGRKFVESLCASPFRQIRPGRHCRIPACGGGREGRERGRNGPAAPGRATIARIGHHPDPRDGPTSTRSSGEEWQTLARRESEAPGAAR